jgi:methylated-DNA-[protein]-cysteine S-methyltransferase
LDRYFEGQDPGFVPPIRLDGTPFQQTVWELLQTIPYGETMTYGEIAARIARLRGIRKMSAQAVGGAVSRNPIALIIPCHRVIGSNGDLTGYAGGLDRKEWLLFLEHARCK